MELELVDEWYVLELIVKQVEEAGSQAALAEKWGVSQTYISDMVTGKRKPSPKILAQLGLRRAIVRSEPDD